MSHQPKHKAPRRRREGNAIAVAGFIYCASVLVVAAIVILAAFL